MSIRTRNIHFTNWAKVIEALADKGVTVADESAARTFLTDTSSDANPYYYYVGYIKDTQEIYTHGKFYDCSGYDDTEIRELISDLAATVNTKADQTALETLSAEVEENEEVTAAALTELHENKADKSEIPDVSTLATKDDLNLKQDLLSAADFATVNGTSVLGGDNAIVIEEPDHYASGSATVEGSGFVTSVTTNDAGHVTNVVARAITDNDITSISASKITGTIDIDRLPHGALERLYVLTNRTAALENTEISEGDTIMLTEEDNTMFFCVSNTATTFDDKFREYTAASATSVAWSGVTGKPTGIDGWGDRIGVIESGYATQGWVGENYLSKSGGTMTGSLCVSMYGWSNQLVLNGVDSNAGIEFRYSNTYVAALSCAQSNPYWHMGENSYPILHSGNYVDYALPITGGTVNGNITANSFIGSLTGNADTATKLKNYYSSRPTSADVPVTGDGSLLHFKATSSMTTSKPSGDGHILHFNWDGSNGYDAQLFLPTGGNSVEAMQYRLQKATTWGSWKTLIDSDNISSQSVASSTYLGPKNNQGLKYINITKTDNGGQATWVLIADVTNIHTGSSIGGQYGFVGYAVDSRNSGYICDTPVKITCRYGYSAATNVSGSTLALYSNHSYYWPQVVKYGDKYYLAIKIIGSGRHISFFVRCCTLLDTFIDVTDSSLITTVVDGLYFNETVNRLTSSSIVCNGDAAFKAALSTVGAASIGGDLTVGGILSFNRSGSKQNFIYIKESGFGDKFSLGTSFGGSDDSNYLYIASAVGVANTDPELTDKIRIFANSGNVALGGDTASEKLHVYGNVVSTGAFNSYSSNSHYLVKGKEIVGSYETSYFLCDSAPADGYSTWLSGRSVVLATGSTKTKRVTIDANGVTTFTQNCKAPDFVTTSDNRLKDFVSDIYVDFESLKQIPKKYYYWKDKSMGEDLQLGTSAQELAKIYPECVSYDEKEDKYSVSYQKLSIVALAAIDKLYDEIKELKSKLND